MLLPSKEHISLPECKKLVFEFVEYHFAERGSFVTYVVHDGHFAQDEPHSDFGLGHDTIHEPHVHVFMTTKQFRSDGFYGNSIYDLDNVKVLEDWRIAWEQECDYAINLKNAVS